MTTNIYLVRHGEVHNPKQVLYGRLPRFRLTEKGKQQIEQTANFLNDKNINAIYSSPLLRGRQTAEIIRKKLNLPKIFLLNGLHEIKTSAEGQPGKKLDLINHDYYSPPIWKINDDTMERIANRMNKSIKQILKKYQSKSVVAVSHGDPILILKLFLNNLPLHISSIRKEKFDIAQGGVVRLQQINDQPITVKSVFTPKI